MISIWLPVAFATAVAMELWAAIVHGWLWHGPLWSMHRPHHGKGRGPNWNVR